MKLPVRIAVVLLIIALGFGLIWGLAEYSASPAPSGEAYHLVPNWPGLPEGISIRRVSGVDLDSSGDVFVFHRVERVWEGEEFTLDFIPSPTVFILDDETGKSLKT